jgi:DNA gyrase subunit A
MTLLQQPPSDENVEEREIQVELETSFLEYAMSVIVARALPDARDGLKPVHRRILWGAHLMNLSPDRSYVKCGRLVGEVMGKYHPHGDVAIYDALVRMGQPFSLRHPLIDGHGNFGSPADPPAAMRYTECRLAPLAMVMLAGIDEDTVDLVPNYSGEFEEPAVLPARLPNLLVNGAQGIAVGMATNIPPHNLGEVVAAAVHLVDHPNADSDRLARIVRGPDFPTGGVIVGRDGILDAYRTGRGSVRVRASARIEPGRRGDRIVVSELPYQVSVETVAEKIGEIVEGGGLQGVREIIDESAKGETRFVVELRPGARGEEVLAQLFKQTTLETNFAVNCVALVSGVPRTLSLRDALVAYLDHQYEVVRRRSDHRLGKARARAHIVEGRLRVLDVLDAVIAMIRASDDRGHARAQLMAEPFSFTEPQAADILNMQLGQLTRLSRLELEEEIAALRLEIGALEEVLTDDTVLRRVVKEELEAVATEHATPRRTRILESDDALAAAADLGSLVADAPREVRITATGFVSAVDPVAAGRRRATRTFPDGPTAALLDTTEAADILVVGRSGTVHRLAVRDVPVHDKPAKGAPVGEPVVAAFAVPHEGAADDERTLLLATAQGGVKRVRFAEIGDLARAASVAALAPGDHLVAAVPLGPGDEHVALATRGGKVIRFDAEEVRVMGRPAGTIAGLKVLAGDEVIWAGAAPAGGSLIGVSATGLAKRTAWDEYPVQGRGGQGVRGYKLGGKAGETVTAWAGVADDADELWLASAKGATTSVRAGEVAAAGRDTGGARLGSAPPGPVVRALVRPAAAAAAPDAPSAPAAPSGGGPAGRPAGSRKPAGADDGSDSRGQPGQLFPDQE